MSGKTMAATGLFGAIAVAGAVGLLMSKGNSMPRRVAKRTGKVMNAVGQKMQDVGHMMKKV